MSEGLFFVGPGRMGLALGYALWQQGVAEPLTYCGQRPEPPAHPLFIQGDARYVFGLERPPAGTTAVILSVPDDVLVEMATALQAQGRAPAGAAAFHLSGALGTDPLAPLHAAGYSVGTLHPFQTVAHPVAGAEALPGSYFAVSGEPQALSVAYRLLNALGSPSLSIPVTRRPLYHAAGVFASNYLQAVLGVATRLLARAGVPEEDAFRAVIALAGGALGNLERMGPERAVTGPVVRGDLETIHLHLRMLEGRERMLYAALGRELLEGLRPPVSDGGGGDPAEADRTGREGPIERRRGGRGGLDERVRADLMDLFERRGARPPQETDEDGRTDEAPDRSASVNRGEGEGRGS